MYSDKQEIEWQFDATEIRPVARWLASGASGVSGFEVELLGEKRLSDVYLDTPDWRFFRAGYTLRVRRKGGAGGRKYEATMKLLDSSGDEDGPKVRREVTGELPSGEPGGIAGVGGRIGEWVGSLVGGGELREVFRVETTRDVYRVTAARGKTGDGVPVSEVALDETEIPVPGGDSASLRRVEVEVESGVEGDFSSFVEDIAERFRLMPSGNSKFEAGLEALGLEPSRKVDTGSTERNESLTAGEYAFAALREQFGEFIAREPGVRLGEDPEELHGMRVASRRSRAAIKVFAGALPARALHFEKEFKWVANLLGGVRDFDVQLQRVGGWLSEAEAGHVEPLEELRDALRERRKAARRTMLRSLDARRYERFMEDYSDFLKRGSNWRPLASRLSVRDISGGIVRKSWRKFRRAGDEISPYSSPEEYHELRKRGKRLRYTLEFLAPIYGDPADQLVSSLKKVQDVLGDHQDAETAIEELRAIADTPDTKLSARTCFVMGGYAARYGVEAARLREEFPDVYSGVGEDSWKRLGKELRRKASESGEG